MGATTLTPVRWKKRQDTSVEQLKLMASAETETEQDSGKGDGEKMS